MSVTFWDYVFTQAADGRKTYFARVQYGLRLRVSRKRFRSAQVARDYGRRWAVRAKRLLGEKGKILQEPKRFTGMIDRDDLLRR